MLRRILKLTGIYWIYEKLLESSIKNKPLPKHVALILDGNRRWAISRGLKPSYGHRVGADIVEMVLDWCLELGIQTITLYALSTENLKRPKDEVDEIFRIIKQKAEEMLDSPKIHDNRVRVTVIGRRFLIPEDVRKALEMLEERTKGYDKHFLNIAIAYGGRAEIVDAARKLARMVLDGKISPDDIDEHAIESCLYTSCIPNSDPDLIIRTSGEERISNFLLWQSAYSELVFLDIYWPEFRRIDLLRAIRTFQQRSRRFGI